jgi:hypothetical protein
MTLTDRQPFERQPCPILKEEDLDEGIETSGIDFLGQYDTQGEITVTLHWFRLWPVV